MLADGLNVLFCDADARAKSGACHARVLRGFASSQFPSRQLFSKVEKPQKKLNKFFPPVQSRTKNIPIVQSRTEILPAHSISRGAFAELLEIACFSLPSKLRHRWIVCCPVTLKTVGSRQDVTGSKNFKPSTLNPQPSTLNPQPSTRTRKTGRDVFREVINTTCDYTYQQVLSPTRRVWG